MFVCLFFLAVKCKEPFCFETIRNLYSCSFFVIVLICCNKTFKIFKIVLNMFNFRLKVYLNYLECNTQSEFSSIWLLTVLSHLHMFLKSKYLII